MDYKLYFINYSLEKFVNFKNYAIILRPFT